MQLQLSQHQARSAPRRQVAIELATPRVAVAVFGDKSPSDFEWQDYMSKLTQLGSGGHRTLVLTRGGGPSVLQREQLAELMDRQRDVKVAVLTDSVFARGIVTALRWFRRDANAAFDPRELEAALDYLELDERERERVRALVPKLVSYLGLDGEFDFS